MPPTFLLSPKLRRDVRAANARTLAAAANTVADWPKLHLKAVREIWADAVTDIPHYAALVASGRAPREIRSWDDFETIPVLTREAIQDRPANFLRLSGPPDGFVRTAGSTGTPLCLGVNQVERDRMRLLKLSAWQTFGYTPASRLFLIWGHSHLLGTGWKGKVNHLKRKCADIYLGYRRVNAYRLDRTSCAAYAEQLVRFNPIGLIGYASALDLFARYTPQFRDRFRALDVRFVLSTAEPPPRTDTFHLLEDMFGCPVVQEYGGADFGQLAWQAGAAPFEVYSDVNYVECESPHPEDPQSHPLLLTSLYPRYVPLFRYRVHDAVLGPVRLPHGHVLRFTAVAGRVNDVITLEDGDCIHSVSILHCIHQEPSVHNIQMVVSDDGIVIRLVTTESNRGALEARIRKRLSQVHPLLVKVNCQYVEDLQTTGAGKRRWCVDNRSDKPGSSCSRQLTETSPRQ